MQTFFCSSTSFTAAPRHIHAVVLANATYTLCKKQLKYDQRFFKIFSPQDKEQPNSTMYGLKTGAGKGKAPMYQHRRPNFDKQDDKSKPWAKTGAWFLGPKADNAGAFKEFVNKTIDGHIQYRQR